MFAAKKGQRVLVNCWAWRIDSQLDGTLMVFDAAGQGARLLGRLLRQGPVPRLHRPGRRRLHRQGLGLRLRRRRRLTSTGSTIGSLPHLDAVVPAAVRPGEKTTRDALRPQPARRPARPAGSDVQGRPLEVDHPRGRGRPPDRRPDSACGRARPIRPAQATLDGMAYRLATPEGSSNPIFLGFTDDPVLVEREPNDDRETAQERARARATSPARSSPAGDVDFYRVPGQEGGEGRRRDLRRAAVGPDRPVPERLRPVGQARLLGRRRRRPEHRPAPVHDTNSNDGRWDLTAPADGEHMRPGARPVLPAAGRARGSPTALSVRRPRPDFRLVAVPTHDIQPDATDGRPRRPGLARRAGLPRTTGSTSPIRVEATGPAAGRDVRAGRDRAGQDLGPAGLPGRGRGARSATPTSRITGTGDDRTARARSAVARGGGLTWPTVNTPGIARMADGIAAGRPRAAAVRRRRDAGRGDGGPGRQAADRGDGRPGRRLDRAGAALRLRPAAERDRRRW